MRNLKKANLKGAREQNLEGLATEAVPCEEDRYFSSFYQSTLPSNGEIDDSMTIGAISEMESRFHYNSVENSIIRALSRIQPPPAAPMVRAWQEARYRKRLTHVDVGAGAGHWIEFMRKVFQVTRSTAIEFNPHMASYLKKRWEGVPGIDVCSIDVVSPDGALDHLAGRVDYITAIGVMFHIVSDNRWARAIAELSSMLSSSGVILVSGDFGIKTQDREFARTDDFLSWSDYSGKCVEGPSRVTKRVRSLAAWNAVLGESGLVVVDLIRAEWDTALTTPENDILVVKHAVRS